MGLLKSLTGLGCDESPSHPLAWRIFYVGYPEASMYNTCPIMNCDEENMLVYSGYSPMHLANIEKLPNISCKY